MGLAIWTKTEKFIFHPIHESFSSNHSYQLPFSLQILIISYKSEWKQEKPRLEKPKKKNHRNKKDQSKRKNKITPIEKKKPKINKIKQIINQREKTTNTQMRKPKNKQN